LWPLNLKFIQAKLRAVGYLVAAMAKKYLCERTALERAALAHNATMDARAINRPGGRGHQICQVTGRERTGFKKNGADSERCHPEPA
jgi:hypothetical protein